MTEPWQVRLEALAMLLVVTVVVALGSSLVSAYAQLGDLSGGFSGAEGPVDLADVLRVGGTAANLAVAGALVVAFLLVALGPGDRAGAMGTTVLRGVVVVGLVTAGIGGISSVLNVLDEPDRATFSLNGPSAEGFLSRASLAAPSLVAALLAVYVAWCAFSSLGDVRAEPVASHDPSD